MFLAKPAVGLAFCWRYAPLTTRAASPASRRGRSAAYGSQSRKDKKTPSQGAGRSHQESGDGGFLYWKAGPRVLLARTSLVFAVSEPAKRLCPKPRID